VFDAFPGHVSNVQQAVDTAEIHERTVIGQVLDDALHDHTFLERGKQRLTFGAVREGMVPRPYVSIKKL
jgi:hypothetical protein